MRVHPDSSGLSDERWADAARRVLAATGIAPTGDEAGCRWIALLVDSHEIRVIAPLMRQDGHPPRLDREHSRALAACQLMEQAARAGRRSGATASSASAPSGRLLQADPQRAWALSGPPDPARRPR
ncbi:hypothetical protein ACFVH7_12425 [Kitasatospora indigofera]|uniref:hypothetical protein n=1 Tax=Kitasatospora indigofera TaxID=67307 RepID=UPI0036336638